jgi:hypothetical protein
MYIPGRTCAYCRYVHVANLDMNLGDKDSARETEIQAIQVVEKSYLPGEENCCVANMSCAVTTGRPAPTLQYRF